MKILSVSEKSTGALLGLKPGDRIEAIDGSRVRDIIDYRFKSSDENIVLRVRHKDRIEEYDIISIRIMMMILAWNLKIFAFVNVQMTAYFVL